VPSNHSSSQAALHNHISQLLQNHRNRHTGPNYAMKKVLETESDEQPISHHGNHHHGHHRHGILHDNLSHNFHHLRSETKQSTPGTPSTRSPTAILSPILASPLTPSSPTSPLNPIISTNSTSSNLMQSTPPSPTPSCPNAATPVASSVDSPYNDPIITRSRSSRTLTTGRHQSQYVILSNQLSKLQQQTSDQIRKFERMLNPKRKSWMPTLMEYEMNSLQSYQFGEQNDSFNQTYNVLDFKSDKQFYEQFIYGTSPSSSSMAIPTITIDFSV